MRKRTKSSLAITTVTLIGIGLMSSPASAEDAPATLNIVKLVENTHGGILGPTAFTIHLTKNGTEVLGSPMTGGSGNGQSFSLAPGVYNLFENPVDKYRGVWSGEITAGGTVTLTAGQVLTVTRTSYDIGTTVDAPTAEEPTADPVGTTDGGSLPNTASPLGNSIFLGFGLITLSLIGFGSRKILSKQ